MLDSEPKETAMGETTEIDATAQAVLDAVSDHVECGMFGIWGIDGPAMTDALRPIFVPEGSVVVDRARFERLLTAAEAAHEWANCPYDHAHDAGGELWIAAEQALVRSTMALRPGDLDPLPE
jgi:hypothetical protein